MDNVAWCHEQKEFEYISRMLTFYINMYMESRRQQRDGAINFFRFKNR
jgi:hypothetical protein